MSCLDCKYCLQVELGYSNWTVEGVEVYCLMEAHPNMPIDKFYGEEPELSYADQCPNFILGLGVYIDVDEADRIAGDPLSLTYTDDLDVADLLDKWEGV